MLNNPVVKQLVEAKYSNLEFNFETKRILNLEKGVLGFSTKNGLNGKYNVDARLLVFYDEKSIAFSCIMSLREFIKKVILGNGEFSYAGDLIEW